LAKRAGNGQALPIADFRLSIEEVVWQLPPLSISDRPAAAGKSAIPDVGRKQSSAKRKTLALRGE
jgi:hypothetical protein